MIYSARTWHRRIWGILAFLLPLLLLAGWWVHRPVPVLSPLPRIPAASPAKTP